LGAFLLTFALAFGLGSKDVITNLLFTFMQGKTIPLAKKKVNSHQGEIIAIDNISLTLKTASGKLIIPIQQMSITLVTRVKLIVTGVRTIEFFVFIGHSLRSGCALAL
jgi:methyl coenzyme M reductase subunit D